jgi:CO/xanthine dehydrogenase Mo-binding subunit
MTEHHNGHDVPHGGALRTADVALALEKPEYRVDGPYKVTGRARYVNDVRLPGTLFAKFLLSPLPHARIRSIDTTAAKAVPGVHAVLTGQDIGLHYFGRVLYDWPVLAYERVLFVGERVAAVAAETVEAAEEAVKLIDVDYEELTPVFDAEEALAPGAPIFHPNGADYSFSAGKRPAMPHANLQGYSSHQKGEADIERVFAQAYKVIEDVYTGPRQHQGYIEPHGCQVWIDADGILQVVSTNKAPFGLRACLAKTLDLPPDKIVVDSMFIGGDFGGKGLSIDEYACYFLAKATGRPIRSIMTYADELGAGAPQHSAKYYLRTAVNREGKIIAHTARAFLNGGGYGGGRPNPQQTSSGGLDSMEVYNIPNARLESSFVYTNHQPTGNMRAPGSFHRGLAGEGHIDHIAREIGVDPLEFRLRNVLRAGETTLTGSMIRRPRVMEVLETLKRETKWGETKLPPGRGRGIAVRTRHVGQGKAEIYLHLLPGGTVEILTGAPDQGGGAYTVAARVAAATLSIPVDRINVRFASTGAARFDGGIGGSRGTHVVGRVTLQAAQILKSRLEELAAEVMGWPAGDVRLENDRFVVGDGSRESAPFPEVAQRIAQGPEVDAVGAYDAADTHSDEGGDYNIFAYMVEVDVDRDTGQVRPTDVLAVIDVGTIINPTAHQGQLDGGFIYGWGQSMTEELVIEDGRVTTASLGEYKLPTQMDTPPFRTILLENEDGPGPFGAKAAGETTNTGVGGAVANAIYDAVGVQVTTAPITAERVYALLQEQKAAAV